MPWFCTEQNTGTAHTIALRYSTCMVTIPREADFLLPVADTLHTFVFPRPEIIGATIPAYAGGKR